ncbi:MAG: GNAT family N-acetyltransferase [Bacteroidia bacterium]|nr:GNAT family N-acetyltransferase [Bacteroidota bacterium]MCE1201820.1 GNAT family N-acetyltransferase [Bacteroidia bacterium]
MIPENHSAKCTLRPWRLSDLDSLVRYANNPRVAANLTDQFPSPYSRVDGEAFINAVSEDNPVRVMAIDVDGEAVGAIGVFPQSDVHRLNAEMGYWLAEPFWGRGIVSSAVNQMVQYAFANFGINRIFARPFGTNRASQRVLEKNGFVLEARFKEALIKNEVLLDELIYAIRRTKP